MKSKNSILKLLAIAIFCLAACSKSPEIDNATMLDGDLIFDASIYNPEQYLVSQAIAIPTTDQKNSPVIIVAHGYSASTFEWDEFKAYCDNKNKVLVSKVLLGGHGRTYEAFKNSSWADWQQPIMDEYNALRQKGYTNINFAGSSTGSPLMLDLIRKGKIVDNGMNNIFLVDPIVVSSSKLLTLIGVVGPMLGYLETENSAIEAAHWYHFRPQETLKQLLNLLEKVRKDLQAGYRLPVGTRLKVYKSIKDSSADPVSAVLIHKGLKNNDGSNVEVAMIDSKIHVITRLAGREGVTQDDRDIQLAVFDDMHKRLLE